MDFYSLFQFLFSYSEKGSSLFLIHESLIFTKWKLANGEQMWRWVVRISDCFHIQGRETTQQRGKTLNDSGLWK